MPERKSRSISRSPELNERLQEILRQRGWSRRNWASESHVGEGTVMRVFDLDGGKGVSARLFSKMTSHLVPDDAERIRLLKLAGLSVTLRTTAAFGHRINAVINRFDLTPGNRAILEDELLDHVRTLGSHLEQTQKTYTLPLNN